MNEGDGWLNLLTRACCVSSPSTLGPRKIQQPSGTSRLGQGKGPCRRDVLSIYRLNYATRETEGVHGYSEAYLE